MFHFWASFADQTCTFSWLRPHNRLCFWSKHGKSLIRCPNDGICFLSPRRTMTLRKGTFRSTRGLLLPSTSPKWTPLNPKSCWNCPRRAGPWWCSPQCRGSPQRRKRRRSQDCGRAASSMPILTFRGLKFICSHQQRGQNVVTLPFTTGVWRTVQFTPPSDSSILQPESISSEADLRHYYIISFAHFWLTATCRLYKICSTGLQS